MASSIEHRCLIWVPCEPVLSPLQELWGRKVKGKTPSESLRVESSAELGPSFTEAGPFPWFPAKDHSGKDTYSGVRSRAWWQELGKPHLGTVTGFKWVLDQGKLMPGLRDVQKTLQDF